MNPAKKLFLFVGPLRSMYALTVLFLLTVLSCNCFADAPVLFYGSGSPVSYYSSGQAACDGQYPNMTTFSQTPTSLVAGGYGSCMLKTSGALSFYVPYTARCSPNGTAPNTSLPLAQQCTADTTCAGYATPALAITNSFVAMQNPVCSFTDSGHINISCAGSVNGKQTTVAYACKGGGSSSVGVDPLPVPTPLPSVSVDYPKCPAGSYSYTDTNGSSACTTAISSSVTPQPCASGNAGTVNGVFVCLPANPAPAAAASAAADAAAQAEAAKAAPATSTASAAAIKAAADAQAAKDAANSLPTDSGTQSSASVAIISAKQAAGYAGTSYTGPKSVSGASGGGTGTTPTVVVCGVPGNPKCQIDETGTPTDGNSTFQTQSDALTTAVTAHTDALTQVTSSDGKDTSWGWLPSFPSATCTPIQFGALPPINWCPVVPDLQSIMSYLWGLVSVFFMLHMVSGALKGK